MKKNMLMILIILSIAVMFVGCKKEVEPVESTPEPPVEEPIEEADEDEKAEIINNFNNLVSGESKLGEIIDYIDKNIEKLSKLEGDMMIDSLEISLENNINELADLIFATDKDNELIQIAGLEKYFPEDKIEEIENEELKELITEAFNNNYKFINLEAEYYPIIDYSKLYKEYSDNISDEWNEYIEIRAMDSDEAPFADGGLRITFKELANRILKTENFLNKYIAGPRQEVLIDLYENKLTAYMKGLPNTPIADYADKKVFEDVMNSYEATSNMEGYVTAHMAYQYKEAIKANNNIINDSILAKADAFIEEALRMLREYK